MHNDTRTTIRSICRADGTISEDQINTAIEFLDGKAAADTKAKPLGRLMSRGEVAKRLGKSPKTIDWYCKKGILKQVKMPGVTRSCGITEESVRNALECVCN